MLNLYLQVTSRMLDIKNHIYNCFRMDIPLSFVGATDRKTFGYFVRVLIDLDMTQKLRVYILIEREVYAFVIYMDYEKL